MSSTRDARLRRSAGFARKDELFKLRVSADELAEWRSEAERDGLTVSAWLRRSAREVIAVSVASRLRDEEAALRAERLHRLPPTEARRIFERGGEA